MRRKILLIQLLCCAFVGAMGQQITWDGSKDFVDITRNVQVLEDPAGKLDFDQVQSAKYQHEFKPSDKAILNFGFTTSVYWLRFSFNNTATQNLVFEIAHAFLPETDLYYKDSSGKAIVIHAGYKIPLN